jgi:5-methylcytosine-specific restriction endonuclease McrA
MSFSNPYRHPTFQNIKDKYRSLKEPHQLTINELEQAKEAIWQASIEHKVISLIAKLPVVPCVIAFGLCLLVIEELLNFTDRILPRWVVVLLTVPGFGVVVSLAHAVSLKIRNRVIQRNQSRLRPFEERANIAEQELSQIDKSYNAEWTSTCETFSGYPPDWNDRCAMVKSRDGYACTACGYPAGFQRRTRELHVHHITAISEGGTNDIDNLTTLCHICHRKVDSKHHGVKRINKLHSRRR